MLCGFMCRSGQAARKGKGGGGGLFCVTETPIQNNQQLVLNQQRSASNHRG